MRVEEIRSEDAAQLLQAAGLAVKLGGAATSLTLLLREGVNVIGVLEMEMLPFDSALFGAPAARISATMAPNQSGHSALLAACEAQCLRRGIRHVVRRLPVGEFGETWALEGAGYRVVDVSVLFERASAPAPEHVSPAIRSVYPEEAEALAEQYAGAFTLTRFAVDPFCTTAAARELHRQWILNSCRGRADAVLVHADGNHLQGFVTCRVDPASQTGGIELIAVDPRCRGTGAGRQLVAGALFWFHDRVRRVEVRTQLNNAVAIGLYQASGFKVKLGELTYSRVFGEEKASV